MRHPRHDVLGEEHPLGASEASKSRVGRKVGLAGITRHASVLTSVKEEDDDDEEEEGRE